MEPKDNFIKVKHLYHRAGFGIPYGDLEISSRKRISKTVDELFNISDATDDDLTTVVPEEYRQQQMIQSGFAAKKDLSPAEREQRKAFLRMQNEEGRKLNTNWLFKMIGTDAPLREKMTLFWHGHFACRSNNPLFAQQLNNIQRRHALGNFRTLLLEVSKSPAMLQYLNNQQNRKNRPNENFARELMELFTMGRGNYTEQDVKESARAFTGWAYNKEGEFEFRRKFHDEADKTFFIRTGNFDGEAIIDIILEQPATAKFICTKLYRFFVNDQPNPVRINELASHFYRHNYNIAAVMRKMFESEWFYEAENIGNKIKSPAEFLITLSRTFFVTYHKPRTLIQFQTSLGQYLFNPPNVAGWPGGKSWIDSSSLMLRMKIPSLVLNNGIIDFEGKADPEDETLIAVNRKAKGKPAKSVVQAEANWPKFLDALPADCSPIMLANYLLQPDMNKNVIGLLNKNTSLKNAAIAITSLPEYQLC